MEGTSALKAMTPQGVGVLVPLPSGAAAGTTLCFSATMPPSALKMPNAPAVKTKDDEYSVPVPPDVGDGERFRALLPPPYTQTVVVTVPANGAGKTLLFTARARTKRTG
eukprot:1233443-Prymnesium_polylepis.2